MKCIVHPPVIESLPAVLMQTNCPGLKLISRGKVRDIYDLGDQLLIVATDRLSAFDVVMLTGIPDKGRVLTDISEFWLKYFSGVVNHHFISTNPKDFPKECWEYAEQLDGRSMLVDKADEVLKAECIVRGYLVGSGWESYQKDGTVCGIKLPPGLQEAEKLPEPIFTPSTKAPSGQSDVNISFEEMCAIVGRKRAEEARDISLQIYNEAATYAEERGILLADTKFEFGLIGNYIVLVDEVLTPDSSRFWPKARYQVGTSPESYDKQFVRDHLKRTGWKKSMGGIELPEEIVMGTRERYLQAEEELLAA